MPKPFSQNLYLENDQESKMTGIELISSLKNTYGEVLFKDVVAGEENYKSDFSATMVKNNKKYLFEVERKKVWQEKGYFNPLYSDIQVPARKAKCNANCFIMFNYYYDTALMTGMNLVKSSPIREVNAYNFKNDQFFAVPLEQFVLFEKTENGWQKISIEEHKTRRKPKNMLFICE